MHGTSGLRHLRRRPGSTSFLVWGFAQVRDSVGVLGESAGTYTRLAMSVRSKTVEDFKIAGGESNDNACGGGAVCENGGCAGRWLMGRFTANS